MGRKCLQLYQDLSVIIASFAVATFLVLQYHNLFGLALGHVNSVSAR